jgi:hypothetical protein
MPAKVPAMTLVLSARSTTSPSRLVARCEAAAATSFDVGVWLRSGAKDVAKTRYSPEAHSSASRHTIRRRVRNGAILMRPGTGSA